MHVRGRDRVRGDPDRAESYGHGRERGMKVALPGGDLRITPQHYQRLIKKVVGKPEERIISYLMLRSLKQARYAAEPLAFRSRLRRVTPISLRPFALSDLIVHRILKWALEHPNDVAQPPRRTLPLRHPRKAVSPRSHGRHCFSLPNSAAKLGFSPRGARSRSHALLPPQLEEIAAETPKPSAAPMAPSANSWTGKPLNSWNSISARNTTASSFRPKFGCFVELFEVFVEGLLPINALEEFAGARCVLREAITP